MGRGTCQLNCLFVIQFSTHNLDSSRYLLKSWLLYHWSRDWSLVWVYASVELFCVYCGIQLCEKHVFICSSTAKSRGTVLIVHDLAPGNWYSVMIALCMCLCQVYFLVMGLHTRLNSRSHTIISAFARDHRLLNICLFSKFPNKWQTWQTKTFIDEE